MASPREEGWCSFLSSSPSSLLFGLLLSYFFAYSPKNPLVAPSPSLHASIRHQSFIVGRLEPGLVVVCRSGSFRAQSTDFGHSRLQTCCPTLFLEPSASWCTTTILYLTSTHWWVETTRHSRESYSQMHVMHAPTKGLLSSTSGFSDAPRCCVPLLLQVFCGFLIFCFVFLLCLLCCICFSLLVFLCCFVGYLGFCLLICCCVLFWRLCSEIYDCYLLSNGSLWKCSGSSNWSASWPASWPASSNTLCGSISWFFNQDPEDWVIFFLAHFLLFVAVYFYFETIVEEPTLILNLGSPTFFPFQSGVRKIFPCNSFSYLIKKKKR